MSEIFLSYDGRDVERVKPLAAALESQGWKVFYDRTIPPGKTWRQFIGKEIDECRCMVVVWSNHSIDSHWVCEEADIGLKRHILVPLLLDRVDPPLGFRSIQAADLVDRQANADDPGFSALYQAIAEIIGPGTALASVDQEENSGSGSSKIQNATVYKIDQSTEQGKSLKRGDNEKAPSSAAGAKNRSPIIERSRQQINRPKYDAPKILLISIVAIALLIWASQGQQVTFEVPPKITTTDSDSAKAKRQKEPSPMNNSMTSQQLGIKEPDMVEIPAGNFQMGSKIGDKDEQPVHAVKLNRFAIGRYEVTFDEYDQFAEATGKPKPEDKGWGRGSRPVIEVSWNDAQAYAGWLSEKTGKRYRLPGEAEWEYAARAGTTGDFYWGDGDKAEEFSRYWANSEGKTQPVGEKLPNDFGLHDMSGNVWEWVQDCWHENYLNAPTDETAWEERNNAECKRRVLRGGSWYNDADDLRSTNRDGSNPDLRDDNVGFRLAQDLP